MWEHFAVPSDMNLSSMGIYDQLNLENFGTTCFFQYPHQLLSGAAFLQTRLFRFLCYHLPTTSMVINAEIAVTTFHSLDPVNFNLNRM